MNKRWQEFYEMNTKLDDKFNSKYESDKKIHEKNCIETLVELGEFINETKCFKYWSIKKPNMDNVYEEASDVLQMLLYFYNYFGISKVSTCKMELTSDLLLEIDLLFRDTSKLLTNGNKSICKKVYTRFMHVTRLLNMDEELLLDACFKKNKINHERLNSEY